MARAFDRAWEDFTRSGILINSSKMRAELAAFIVELAKTGENDERRLAMAGLRHLREIHRSANNAPDAYGDPKSKYDRAR